MRRTLATCFFIAAALPGLILPVAVAQSGRPEPHQISAAPPLPPPSYSLTEAPEGYTLKHLEFFEAYAFNEVNKQRQERGLAPLIFLDALLPAARSYSRQQAEENFFSHTDPAGRTVRDRLRNAGIRWVVLGENLSHATGYLDPVPDVVASWMRNPEHRANILSPEYRYAALGVWIKGDAFFFTEVFLDKR